MNSFDCLFKTKILICLFFNVYRDFFKQKLVLSKKFYVSVFSQLFKLKTFFFSMVKYCYRSNTTNYFWPSYGLQLVFSHNDCTIKTN